MSSYYDANKPTTANFRDIEPSEGEIQHFPTEGLYFGSLHGGAMDVPALVDLNEIKGLCFLYNDESTRTRVNHVLERLAWRLALTVPSNLCDMVLYDGGNPGDSFSTHANFNRYIVDERADRVFFDGNREAFCVLLNEMYQSIQGRVSAINNDGKRNLIELNEALGNDARMKYHFVVLTDFPRHQNAQTMQKLAQIIETGNKAGIYVLMSWDMNADFDPALDFNPQDMLSGMELLYPQGQEYHFKNSGHDDVLNRFRLILDDTSINPLMANQWADTLNRIIEKVKKNCRPSAIKQDFVALEKSPYEPVMSELNVTVGLDVNDKHPVTIRFNSGDYIHGFILGQSGSGKSVLLNNIISSLILKYSPEDLMLYLMDFKGVEFNRYRGVKHTKAVLVDNSDPQMTLEVLRELRDENKRRVKLWQQESVNNIDGYNRKYPSNRLPQILFVADECQVMFKESTSGTERVIQREISEILNIIATQGRSQGIHMLLATQQLDETDISGQILKNLTECFLLMSAPSDSDKLVPDSSDITSKQMTGLACYYHKKTLQSQVKTFFASDDELATVIQAAQQKAGSVPGNGQYYFCGSQMYWLKDVNEQVVQDGFDCPVALVGQNIGINAGASTIPLRKDFLEHILIFGANKQEQSTGVLLNALMSLIHSYAQKDIYCNFLVIDCQPSPNASYKAVLSNLESKGLCRLIERQNSGMTLKELVDDIKGGFSAPTILAIIESERFIEVKRKMPLVSIGVAADSSQDDMLGFDMSSLQSLMGGSAETDSCNMTYHEAVNFILDEGPMNGVHLLMQLDKPCNVLFGDEYDVEAANKFRHKIILRSENKHISPLRFSQEIDVEMLSDEEEHLRAYYYPEGGDPLLFTPFQMPIVE